MTQSGEKLWGYASLARLFSWTLIVVGGLMLLLSIGLQAATDEGLDGRWYAAAFGITGLTGVISYPLFRVWLRKTALPSVRLPQAVRASGPRLLEATPRDWRRWALFSGVVLTVGGAAMLTFLIGVLGTGGTAEGVVVGMLAAWGAATLEDVAAHPAHRGRRGAPLLRRLPAPDRRRQQAGVAAPPRAVRTGGAQRREGSRLRRRGPSPGGSRRRGARASRRRAPCDRTPCRSRHGWRSRARTPWPTGGA